MLFARSWLLSLSISLALIFVFKANAANDATLFFSPATGSHTQGNIFTIEVDVASLQVPMNSVAGEINFPTSILNVDSVSKIGSMFDLWVQDPSYSNSTGKINFMAVKFNPGYRGPSGPIFKINFRGVNPGTADVTFTSGRVLENDGNGTAMNVSFGTGRYIISPLTIIPFPPAIWSTTHPDQNRWYSNNDPRLLWSFNRNATEVSYIFDKISNTDPDTIAEGAMTSANYNNVDEGVHYFHARLRNNFGWGPSSHFRLQVDTENPEYLDIVQGDTSLDNRVTFNFKSFDKTSGIDYFNFQVDDNQCPWQWRSSNEGVFETSPLLPGPHKLIATVYDRAGNFLTKTIDFNLGGEIGGEAPIIIGGGGGGQQIVVTPTATERTIETVFTPVTIFAPGVSKTATKMVSRGYAILYESGFNFWLIILLAILVILFLLLYLYRSWQYYRLKKEYEELKSKQIVINRF